MSETIIKCGFQNIFYENFFRGKSVSKGRKLFHSHHVQNVCEIIKEQNRYYIHGKVIPQTRVNNPPYDVKLEVNQDRIVKCSICSCKAGLSQRGCKHSAAVCIFINTECTSSSTNQPQQWNRPRVGQLEKYSKGCTLGQMFPGKLVDCTNKVYKFNDVQNVPEDIEAGSLFGQYIKSELELEPQKQIEREVCKLRNEQTFKILGQIYDWQESRKDYR